MFSRTLKFGLSIAVIVALFAVIAPAVLAAPPAPHVGAWQAVDVDGSNLDLAVAGGGTTYRLIWRDDYWTICGGGPGVGRGTASVDPSDSNVLNVDMNFYCGGSLALSVSFDLTYDPATDTLTESASGTPVTWTRR